MLVPTCTCTGPPLFETPGRLSKRDRGGMRLERTRYVVLTLVVLRYLRVSAGFRFRFGPRAPPAAPATRRPAAPRTSTAVFSPQNGFRSRNDLRGRFRRRGGWNGLLPNFRAALELLRAGRGRRRLSLRLFSRLRTLRALPAAFSAPRDVRGALIRCSFPALGAVLSLEAGHGLVGALGLGFRLACDDFSADYLGVAGCDAPSLASPRGT